MLFAALRTVRIGGFRIGLASCFRPLLVLIVVLVVLNVEGTVPGAKGLPPILVLAVEVAEWSDETAPPMHQEQTSDPCRRPGEYPLISVSTVH